MEEPTRKLGPYRLITKIGHGAFGVVWLAEKKTAIATTRCALKVPRDEDIDLEGFKQEAAIWIQASGHPNVLPLTDADMYDNQVVIVSEYVPDGSLSKWLKRHGGKAPTVEAAMEMIDGVLAGLAHLHERNIIHRDLKPDNILLQRNTPRLADFGIARVLRSTSYTANLSGTLAYMAPEAFKRKRNPRTDIWAVGVIFYELLAGRLPYDEPDPPSLIAALSFQDAPPLPESVPEEVRNVVMGALQRNPEQRYESATAMRADLQEAERIVWLKARQARDASTLSLSEKTTGPVTSATARLETSTKTLSPALPVSESDPKESALVAQLETSPVPDTQPLPATISSIPVTESVAQQRVSAARPTTEGVRPTISSPEGAGFAGQTRPTGSRAARPLKWIVAAVVALMLLGTGIVLLVVKISGNNTWDDSATNRATDKANGVAARVNGKPITLTEVDRLISDQPGPRQSQLSAADLAKARLQVLENLIQREALYQRAQREHLEPSEDAITNSINTQNQEKGVTDEEFARQLGQKKTTMDEHRDAVKRDLAINKLQAKYAVNVAVTDGEVEAFYRSHQQEFINRRGVGLGMLVVDPMDNSNEGIQNDARSETEAKSKIDKVYNQLKAGADFVTVVRAQSEDAKHLEDSGDIGFATPEELRQKSFPRELSDQFFGRMEIGSITAPVNFKSPSFPYGRWYIFKLNERRLQSEALTLESPGVREQIARKLMEQRTETSNANLLTTAMNESKIVNYLALG